MSITFLQICTNAVSTRLIVKCDKTLLMRSQRLLFSELSALFIAIDPDIMSKTILFQEYVNAYPSFIEGSNFFKIALHQQAGEAKTHSKKKAT